MEVVEPEEEVSLPSTSTLQEEAPKPKLGDCEVCIVQPAKYTCPRCEVKTCCLKCSNIHKKELECDGNRDRTKYIPMNKFTNFDLSSDYRLLEEISRTVQKCKQDHRITRKGNNMLPHHLYKLTQSSLDRKTKLQFLPYSFERHKKNSTKLNFKRDVIFWHIEWVFINADNLKLTDELVRETEKLSSILSKYFVKQENKVLQERLQYYQAVDVPGIRVFLQAENKPGKKFYELDPTCSLKESFRSKTIIEYPIIHVVLKEHADAYEVVDSDDEDEDVAENNNIVGSKVIDNIVKKSESEESIYKHLKNLLFVSDEEEMST